jgi:hypothetical protein
MNKTAPVQKSIKRTLLILVVLLVISAAGCGSGASYAGRGDSAAPNAAPPTTAQTGAGMHIAEMIAVDDADVAWRVADYVESAPQRTPRIIQTGWVYMQCDNFDATEEALRRMAPEVGGFVERAEVYDIFGRYIQNRPQERTRELSITLRVPRELFDEVMRRVEGLAVVRNSNQSAEDVTARYFDLAGRLETKRIEEERVLEMITRAEDINDLLALENRLGHIRTEIERFQSQMTDIDRLAAFSTIHVTLSETTTENLIITSEGLGERINQAFTRSINNTVVFMQNVLIFLAGAFIPLTIIALLLFIGVRTALRIPKKKNG